MEQDQQPSRAEQRMAAVAKLKRAASLPRMKDGRRPPMHTDAVSEGEKAQYGQDGKVDASPSQEPEEAVEDTVEPDPEVEVQPEAEGELEQEGEPEPEEAQRAVSPGPAARTKRRSRSRSRSRGSKDLRGKVRPTQSPTPTPQAAGDSSPDEASFPPPLNLAALTPLMSPIPSHILELQRSRLLRSPTPTSPEPSMLNSGPLPQSPVLLPTLEAWQRGLFRSNSAGGSNAAGRMMAMHKLTGGTESYDPSGSSSPTPPPFGKLSRNNTVTGGERTAARQLMLSRLGGRIGKETDGEQVSGGEERSAPSPTPKRRRRRSRRGSQSATAGVSDTEFLPTSPNTPTVPQTHLPATFDTISDVLLRSRSATPFQLAKSLNYDLEEPPEPPRQDGPVQEPERLEPARRRSVVVEEDEEEQYPQRTYVGLPSAPPHIAAHIAALRLPHTSDVPSNGSSESAPPSAISVPVYLSQRTPQRTPPGNDAFPRSPYATPLKELLTRDDDEEQVLYQPDTYRPRTPYEDNSEREISWIASPVPELSTRVQIHVEEEDEDDEYRDEEEYQDLDEPSSSRSSNGFSPPEIEGFGDTSFRASSSSKSLVVESETSPAASPSHVSLTPSAAAPSQTTSIIRASDGSTSPPTYPMRLSVASRSPLYGEFSEWDDRAGNTDSNTKRNGDSPSTWEKVKSTFSRAGSSSGRRSRTNSIVTRERRDRADSINRESGASLNSAKTDKVDPLAQQQQQQAQQPLMQSLSASASISSLAPHATGRGAPSPIPPLTPANKSKYQHAKLFPFGMTTAPEEQQRSLLPSASASSPDIVMQSSSNEEDPSFLSAQNTPAQTPEMARERKLSHQASDPYIVTRINPSAPPISPSDSQPRSPSQNGGSYKLPMTLPGVKQWLSKNKKIFSSTPSSSTATPVPEIQPLSAKKPSAPDAIRRKDSEQLGTDWEEIGNTPTSIVGDTFRPVGLNGSRETPPFANATLPRSENTDTEKTPKAKKIMPPDHSDISFFDDSALTPPSRPDPFSSATPDPSSSLSDYPAPSTSESSSTTSSQYSLGPLAPQGPIFLEKIDEELARGSRSRIWATSLDDSPRKLLLATPVFQVVNHNTVKDRFLFLFSDMLVIAKPVFDQEASVDKNPIDRKFVVKSVVMLNQLRFTEGRTELETRETNDVKSRNRLIGSFVHNFAKDPDHAINALYVRSGHGDDPTAVGQLLFKTLDLDRTRLGEYLARRTSKSVLKVYLDSFRFFGLRIDKSLRVFLLSIHIPFTTSHHNNGLEYFLEAFAGRWYEANTRLVDYNKDHAHRFVRAIVQLNDLLHGGIAQEFGPTEIPRREVSSDDFVDAFRRYDQKSSVSDELLRNVYDSILNERLSQSPSTSSRLELIIVKRAIPQCLTWRIESEPIVLRIPHTDPGLSIELYGQDLIFDPPVLNFGKSPEVSFRIKAVSLGSKSILMRRSGPHALKYTGLPLSSPVLVERAFMRHTFQVAFQNHNGLKRRYMFSMDDSVLRHQWAAHIRRQMEKAAEVSKLEPSRFRRATEILAFRVLQETLISSPSAPVNSTSTQKASQRANTSPLNLNGGSRFGGAGSNGFQLAPLHVRSKSRSKVYHQHGAGKNELDFSQLLNHRGLREENDEKANVLQDRNEGAAWSTEELQTLCEQNGTIAPLLSYLQGLSSEQGDISL